MAQKQKNKWTEIGARLRAARIAARLTQVSVAKAIGVTITMVYSWELGRFRPAINRLPSLALLYGVSVDYLLINRPEIEDDDSLLKQAELAFRSASERLTYEDIRSILDYIQFIQEKRRSAEVKSNPRIEPKDHRGKQKG